MSIIVKSALKEIVVQNKKIQCKFYPSTGRFDILSPQGSLINVFPLIFIENESITLLDEPHGAFEPQWNMKTVHRDLIAFFPQEISNQEFSENMVVLKEFTDQIDQGLIAKIPLKFSASNSNGIITGFLCFKLYDSLLNAHLATIYIQIDEWVGFEHTPKIHSYVPLGADLLSKWILHDDYRLNPRNVTFFRNGYQSWSPNNLLGYKQKAHLSILKIGKNTMENQDPAIKTRYFSEMFTSVTDTKSKKSLIIGFTTHKRQFNRILMDRMRFKGKFRCLLAISQVDSIPINLLKPKHIKSEELIVFFTEKHMGVQGLCSWAELSGKIMDGRTYKPSEASKFNGTLSGYCSWYYYYTKVTEQDIIDNLNFFTNNKGYPINLIQLDDGYQTEVGDFTSINEKFPNGMRFLVDKIHDRRFLAGLWIAPFFAQDRSELFQTHPEWFLRDKDGKMILGALNWGSKVYALDISKQAVIDHVKNLIQTIVEDWNYDYIKIDFVYASEIIGSQYYIPGVTRAEVYRNGIEFIRDVMGDDTILLGCGAPLGPSIGIVDAMRIGEDTAAKWRVLGKFGDIMHKRLNLDLPALKPAMQATVLRSFMHKRLWINDPDCVVVRENKSKLSLDEIHFQLTIMGLSGGMIMFSDDLTLLKKERLRFMKLLLPPYKEGASSLDMLIKRDPELFGLFTTSTIGDRILLALLNWKDRNKSIKFTIRDILTSLNKTLKATKFYIYDFWKQRKLPGIFGIDERITISNVVKHGCKYFSIIPIKPNDLSPVLLSSDLHISQGCQEIKKYEYFPEEKKLTIVFDLNYHEGTITILSKTKLKPHILSGRDFETIELREEGYTIKIPVLFPIDKTLTLYFE
ncbi:MAG: alpha-galactosidase [Candidatus Lokiarchaeota archaeon]|nr:alpha-galactosidase [Candidatus Lokiarchaeota archaeon]